MAISRKRKADELLSSPAAITCVLPSPDFFRTLPPQAHEQDNLDYFEAFHVKRRNVMKSPFQDTKWPRLQLDYKFLTDFVTDPRCSTSFSRPVILKILDLFESEDERERVALATLLKGIYDRFPEHRVFIRKSVYDIFCQFNCSSDSKHNGIPELLTFLKDVIGKRGSLCLEDEFRVLLLRSLIPLYKSKWLVMFYPYLRNCIAEFNVKDRKIADSVTQGMLRYWPKQASSREYFFLDAAECFLIEAKLSTDFSSSVVGLLEKIAGSLKSLQFNVAEKALSLLDVNGGLGILTKKNFKFILQIVYSRLKEVAAKHWRPRTKELAVKINTALKAVDPVFYDDCYIASLLCEEDEAGMEWLALAREERWKQLEGMAAARKDWTGLSINFRQELCN
ncbi:hypothetical protein SLEP1_g6637 [Rubroshorea leprosula]|uniref:Uncharacterized protein n=1 Tax=Rubroshorea leprosula TaxID=152421 RepID=A0AAV5I3Y1_9ROSI|nr:hypothetical protein SLEP1_g6637 [Rubroshorea leprosula]